MCVSPKAGCLQCKHPSSPLHSECTERRSIVTTSSTSSCFTCACLKRFHLQPRRSNTTLPLPDFASQSRFVHSTDDCALVKLITPRCRILAAFPCRSSLRRELLLLLPRNHRLHPARCRRQCRSLDSMPPARPLSCWRATWTAFLGATK